MPNAIPPLEVVPSHTLYTAERPAPSGARRVVVFALVFGLCAAIGLFINFSRPAIYQAQGSLLVVGQPAVDQVADVADLQHVAIQRQTLLGQTVLGATLEELAARSAMDPDAFGTIPQLRTMLSVHPVPDTHVLELRAEGAAPDRLAELVNQWMTVYMAQRARQLEQATAATTTALREQQGELATTLENKRAELDRFRQDNEILTLGRDENEIVARLKGLTQSLNTAREAEVSAKARLAAIRRSIARGEPVVPSEDKADLTAMETRAQELREQLADLDKRYTRDFLALQPTLKVIPEQLAELERKIERKVEYGQRIVLTETEQEYAAARQVVRELEQQLEDHKASATEFAAQFAKHEAMQEDLARLEELNRTVEERLVKIEVENREKYPPVTILEYALKPESPVRPAYWRDGGLVLAGSLALGLFAVWLIEFLSRPRREPGPATLAGVSIYANPSPALAPAGTPALEPAAVAALEHPLPRELTATETEALWTTANAADRLLAGLLLSGLTLEEISALGEEAWNRDDGKLQAGGTDGRYVAMPEALAGLLDTPDLLSGLKADEQELQARLQLVAVDAGISFPEQVNAAALRHTYLLYLVRQGAKLAELEELVGKIPATGLTAYAGFSPAGPGRSLVEITTVHPALRPGEPAAAGFLAEG